MFNDEDSLAAAHATVAKHYQNRGDRAALGVFKWQFSGAKLGGAYAAALGQSVWRWEVEWQPAVRSTPSAAESQHSR